MNNQTDTKETLPVLNCGDDDMYNFFLLLSVKIYKSFWNEIEKCLYIIIFFCYVFCYVVKAVFCILFFFI